MIEPRAILKNISRSATNTEGRIGKVMRLDHNERTTDLSREIINEVWKTISPEELVAYPALETLYGKLTGFLNVPRECLLLTYGSDTGIRMIFDTYVNAGDEIIFLDPAYGMFPVYTDMFGGKRVAVEYDADFNLPVNRVLEKINDTTKLVIIANPNHTATVMQPTDIIKVVEKAARHQALVLVDEAYHYYYEGTMLPRIQDHSNLIVLRTFSKAFGIAPLRVGYLASQKGNIDNLYKVKLTHDITSVSAKFVEYLIDHPQVCRDHVREVKEGKDYLLREFAKLGARVLPSEANFVFVRLPVDIDAALLVGGLEKRDIWIRGPFKGGRIEGLIRITVGPPRQMAVFMDHIKQLWDQARVKKHAGQI